jgi:pilus assembly protein CpaB
VAEIKIKSVLLLAVALGCGLVAMLGVQQVLSGNKDNDGVSRVLVATTEINPGTRLNETNSAFQDWPANAIPQGAVTSAEQIEECSLLAYAIPGEIILEGKLSEPGAIGASNEIPEGMRVATVRVDLTKTHSGLMMPGDHVDLVLTFKSKTAGHAVCRTMTILENVKIFATDSKRTSTKGDSNSAENKAKNISLLVTPEQYQVCMLAESKGQLTLALRNAKDIGVTSTRPVESDIFNDNRILGSRLGNEDIDSFPTSFEGDVSGETDVVVQETPTWKIKIYPGGGEVRVEEVELPVGESMQSSFLGSNDRNDQNNLKGWFKKILN